MRLHSRQMKDWPPRRWDGEVEPITRQAVRETERLFPQRVDDGRKMTYVHERFGCSLVRYYMVVNDYIDDAEFIASDPIVARILRQRRQTAQRLRSARRVGLE